MHVLAHPGFRETSPEAPGSVICLVEEENNAKEEGGESLG